MISLMCNNEEIKLFEARNIESLISGRYRQNTDKLLVKLNGKEVATDMLKQTYLRYGDRVDISYK